PSLTGTSGTRLYGLPAARCGMTGRDQNAGSRAGMTARRWRCSDRPRSGLKLDGLESRTQQVPAVRYGDVVFRGAVTTAALVAVACATACDDTDGAGPPLDSADAELSQPSSSPPPDASVAPTDPT